MPELSAAEIASICDGSVVGDPTAVCTGFAADSRALPTGAGFVALRGGHAFTADAVAAGARIVVVSDERAVPAGATAVVVGDSERALGALAVVYRGMLGVRVAAVTGSTGKTITKDLLAAALRSRFVVHAAVGSYNNEVGLPLTILSCPDRADVLVAEMGARHPGDIASLCATARPEVAVVTGIGIAHLEIFGSRAAIAATKGELVQSLPAGGAAVLPANDDFLAVLAARTPARVVTAGPGGMVRAGDVRLDGGGRAEATIHARNADRVRIRMPLAGRALVRNALLAVAAACEMGADPRGAADAISALDAAMMSPWRMQVLHVGGRTIVNDAYNANPTSTASALRTVREIAGARPAWAVLGVMAELGYAADAEHERVGRLAAALGFERVIVAGERAAPVAAGAGARAVVVGDAAEALDAAALAPHDAVVLVKASRVAGLERVAAALAAAGGGIGVSG